MAFEVRHEAPEDVEEKKRAQDARAERDRRLRQLLSCVSRLDYPPLNVKAARAFVCHWFANAHREGESFIHPSE